MLGEHEGTHHFTIGQRRGLEIGGSPEPLYVVRIEPETRRLVVGPRSALAVERMQVEELSWIGEKQSEVTVKPGQRVTVKVSIERRNGFKGRVPLDVKGLPHGVRVLDIGLNGVLITERETSRSFVIYAEPWVQPQEHPFVVLARREGKNTEHAARTVLLKVTK